MFSEDRQFLSFRFRSASSDSRRRPFIREKRRNLYLLPSHLSRLLALPIPVGRQRRSPYAYICNRCTRRSSSQSMCRIHGLTYNWTSIVALSLTGMKFCENFERSRISADKRFLLCLCSSCDLHSKVRQIIELCNSDL